MIDLRAVLGNGEFQVRKVSRIQTGTEQGLGTSDADDFNQMNREIRKVAIFQVFPLKARNPTNPQKVQQSLDNITMRQSFKTLTGGDHRFSRRTN